jgi:hypothetical protein
MNEKLESQLEWISVELAELPYADEYPELECDEVTEEAVAWD